MRPDEFKEFCAVMAAAAETLNQPKLTMLGHRTAFAVLQEYPLEAVKAAIHRHLRESPFMPKPADVVRYVEGTADDRGAMAWGHVVRAIRQHGHYESVRFDDPAIHYAIDRMGGWRKLCGMLEDELPFREKDFREHYRRGEQATWRDVPSRFVGEIELHNTQQGWDGLFPATVEIATKQDKLMLVKGGE